jgi:hypothetical protein
MVDIRIAAGRSGSRRWTGLVLALALAVAGLVLVTVAPSAAASTSTEIGYWDFSYYGSSSSTRPSAPTAKEVQTGGDGTAAVQTTDVKTGLYAARFAETANTGARTYARAPFPIQNDLLVSGDFKILTEGASGANVPLLRLFDSSGTRIVSVYRQNLAGDKLYVQYGGTAFLASKTLPLNTWAHLDVHVTAGGTGASVVELKLNGTSVYSTTVGTLTTGVASAQIGNETAKQTFALVADNITALVPG